MPRYSLLLGNLLKVTPKEHSDFKLISKAIQAVDDVSTHLDKSIKVANDASFVQKTSTQISDFPVIFLPHFFISSEIKMKRLN